MGKRRIERALRQESHEVALQVVRDLSALSLERGGALTVHQIAENCVAEGLEIGLRVAIGDIVAGRRIVDVLDRMAARHGDGAESTRGENAAKLLQAASR